MFVHCWSSLLSPICCCSLAWKQDQECFHTYAHWPLINKSDRGPFPHIHTTRMNTKSIHTDTRSLITETSQSSLTRSPTHLSSQWITPCSPYFWQCRQPLVMSQLLLFFFFFWYNYYFHWWLFLSGSITKHKETCSHQLFTFYSCRDESASTIVWICYLICLATMNGHIEEENVFPWPPSLNVSVKKEQRPGLRKETTLYLQ